MAHAVVQARSTFHWLHEIGSFYLVLTMQLQLILPSMIVDLAIRAYTTARHLRAPCDAADMV